ADDLPRHGFVCNLVRDALFRLERSGRPDGVGFSLIATAAIENAIRDSRIGGCSFDGAARAEIGVRDVDFERPFADEVVIEVEDGGWIRFQRGTAENRRLFLDLRRTTRG